MLVGSELSALRIVTIAALVNYVCTIQFDHVGNIELELSELFVLLISVRLNVVARSEQRRRAVEYS